MPPSLQGHDPPCRRHTEDRYRASENEAHFPRCAHRIPLTELDSAHEADCHCQVIREAHSNPLLSWHLRTPCLFRMWPKERKSNFKRTRKSIIVTESRTKESNLSIIQEVEVHQSQIPDERREEAPLTQTQTYIEFFANASLYQITFLPTLSFVRQWQYFSKYRDQKARLVKVHSNVPSDAYRVAQISPTKASSYIPDPTGIIGEVESIIDQKIDCTRVKAMVFPVRSVVLTFSICCWKKIC